MNIDPPLSNTLNSKSNDIVEDFYVPCLRNSNTYYRGVGYFRSSIFDLLDDSLIKFCLAGGKIKILTSTDFTQEDFEASIEGYSQKQFFDGILELLDTNSRSSVELLIAMISTGCLEIYIAKLPHGGIYHDKVGFFEDHDGNVVSFSGSGNETKAAILGQKGNVESYNIIWNWHESYDVHGSTWESELRSSIDNKKYEGVEIIEICDVDPKIIRENSIDCDLNRYIEVFQHDSLLPTLRDHQISAIKSWKRNGFRGIFEHATGSGKTITSISAIESHLSDYQFVIILVPSNILMRQWEDEITQFLPYVKLAKMGGGYDDSSVINMMTNLQYDDPVIILSTIQTIRDKKNIFNLNRLTTKKPNSTLLLVDECHRVGSESFSDFCDLKFTRTLGLSATPRRYGDEEGTERITNLLGSIIDRYSLSQALMDGHLCEYEYFIEMINLTPQEQETYDSIRIRMSRLYAQWKNSEEKEMPQNLSTLIFESRRIIRGADEKLVRMGEILLEHYDHNQHWLIYCDTESMLNKAREIIRNTGQNPYIYHSKMSSYDQEKTLEAFERDGGILLAIKCLDEGVNINKISHGIILSSTTNPREFIQRRGRLLRKAPGKTRALIFDTFALPNSLDSNMGFILSEILRARELAETSANKSINTAILDGIIREYSIFDDERLEIEGD
ncbi:DEAD/DEAH box helicase family protein [Candidatus Poseidoniaceae archaeon]|nr:DEAD/DEAH box helicase family protein [Candidatus Poseidoniaceae archaeon]